MSQHVADMRISGQMDALVANRVGHIEAIHIGDLRSSSPLHMERDQQVAMKRAVWSNMI